MDDPIEETLAGTSTVIIDDKEYTPDELKGILEERDRLAKDNASLHSDYTKKAQELAEIKKGNSRIDDLLSGEIPASDITEDDIANINWMKKFGYMTKAEAERLFKEREAQLDQIVEKKVEERQRKEKRLAQLNSEIDELTAKYPFVKREDLEKFMADEAVKYNKSGGTDGAIYANATRAARELYFEQFTASNASPSNLPAASAGAKEKATDVVLKTKVLPLGSREMSERMKEAIKANREQIA
jgi:vacuolar-type H+-ATPase subunit I/STV1